MKIVNYVLNMTRETVAVYYEFKVKSEERKAFVTLILITFGIFIIGPLFFAGMIMDIIGQNEFGPFLYITITQSLIIVILALCLTDNAYRAGKLFRLLKKNKNFADMLRYLIDLDCNDTLIRTTYILYFNEYLYSYIAEDKQLVIVYKANGKECSHSIYDYEMMCSEGCEEAVLHLDIDGIRLVDARDEW